VAKRQACKAEAERQAAEKQQQASNDWYNAVDTRVRAHFKDWAWDAIDERIREHIEQWWEHEWDVHKDAIGDAMGTIGRRVRDECKRADEEMQRSFEAKLAEQKERLLAASNSADEAQGRLREEVRQAIKEMCGEFGAQLAALEERLKALPGRLPVAKLWQPDSVTYEAQVVSYDGSLYQACKDTAQMPGGSDWICVARAGRDGHDGLTPHVRGAYDAHKTYARLNIVEYDGAGYLARRDAPGVPGIPGDGWQLMSRSGRRGPVGETGPRGRKGERGARGEAASTITNWTIDRVQYRAVPTMSDGTFGAPLDLRPLFEAYHTEVSA
jgi:hypothetical protein